jgi:phosphoribosyl-AMP cyclohydrolase / phosphoribosyl-ATP pyrophosphohydrolase
MIVPSIDIMGGQAVQLVGGERLAIEAGDPLAVAERFAPAGDLAVIDLDAALGRGDNGAVIREIARRFPCRVGGGIRSRDAAISWLDAGAREVILGTAATPELLETLPRDRVIAAVDARGKEVVVEGWRTRTGRDLYAEISRLAPFVGGFLVTFVEREGRLQGIDTDAVRRAVEAADGVHVTAAGGVTTAAEIAAIDALGADAQVGMAIYSGALDLADALVAPMHSDRADGLWPTIVADERGEALGLAWSDAGSVREALRTRRGVYRSRQRGLWRKGEASGDRQILERIDVDCDRDALRFTVRQLGAGFCHRGTRSCFGDARGLGELARRLAARAASAPPGSYTRRLLDDGPLLASKLREEAAELSAAQTRADTVHEAADLIYFALVAAARAGADLADVERELDRRSLRITRRTGDAKPAEVPR